MRASSSTSSSKRLPASLGGLIACATVFVFLNIVLEIAAPYFDSNYNNMKDINDGAWVDGADVLFLGDSRTHQAMIPAEFSRAAAQQGWEVDAMNLGRPGMQTPFAYFIANRVMSEAARPPKAIVINISFYLLGGDQWMKDIYLAYYRPTISELLTAYRVPFNGAANTPEWLARTWLPVWKLRARVDTFVQTLISDPSRAYREIVGVNEHRVAGDFDVAQGYLTRGDEHISEDDVHPVHYTTGIERGYSAYFQYLDMLFSSAREAGVHVYVYRFPWPEQRANDPDFLNVVDHYWQMLKSHGTENVTFLDELRFWPVEYFIDPLHLNHTGAQQLSAELGAQIAVLNTNGSHLRPDLLAAKTEHFQAVQSRPQ